MASLRDVWKKEPIEALNRICKHYNIFGVYGDTEPDKEGRMEFAMSSPKLLRILREGGKEKENLINTIKMIRELVESKGNTFIGTFKDELGNLIPDILGEAEKPERIIGLKDVGELADERAHVAERVLKHIQKVAEEHEKREVSGYLLGKRGIGGKPEVTDFIHSGVGGEASTSLDDAHLAWEINRDEYKEKGIEVVGWYHSHPNYSAFYSRFRVPGVGTIYGLPHDLETHLQLHLEHGPVVGIVIDPIRKEIGAQTLAHSPAEEKKLKSVANKVMNADPETRWKHTSSLINLIKLKLLKVKSV